MGGSRTSDGGRQEGEGPVIPSRPFQRRPLAIAAVVAAAFVIVGVIIYLGHNHSPGSPAQRKGVPATPTSFMNGREVEGYISFDQLERLVAGAEIAG